MFNDIKIKEGQGLASIEITDMVNASKGVNVLLHAMGLGGSTKQLQEASAAAMDASTGNVTIVNANNNSKTSQTSGDTVLTELASDHDEGSQGILGFIKSIID